MSLNNKTEIEMILSHTWDYKDLLEMVQEIYPDEQLHMNINRRGEEYIYFVSQPNIEGNPLITKFLVKQLKREKILKDLGI